MSLLIRTANLEDSDPILALMVAVINATVDHAYKSDTIDNVSSNLEHWKSNSDRCVHLVAEIDSTIIGVILVKEFWNLCSLFVDVGKHRKGIGKALTQEAIRMCQGQSPVEAIFLNSSPFAVEFYIAFGFSPRTTSQALHPGVQPMRYDFLSQEA